jgi:hypothetical protein
MMYSRINELLKENFHTLQPAECCVTEEAPNIYNEDVTTHCQFTHLGAVIDEHGVMVE